MHIPFAQYTNGNGANTLLALDFAQSKEGVDMPAMLRVTKDHVQVEVIGSLDFRVWSVMRDARETALAAKLPLRVDMRNCSHGDMGGIGSMLLAEDALSVVEFTGCRDVFESCFPAFGVCKGCSTNCANAGSCDAPRRWTNKVRAISLPQR